MIEKKLNQFSYNVVKGRLANTVVVEF